MLASSGHYGYDTDHGSLERHIGIMTIEIDCEGDDSVALGRALDWQAAAEQNKANYDAAFGPGAYDASMTALSGGTGVASPQQIRFDPVVQAWAVDDLTNGLDEPEADDNPDA